MQLSKHFTLSEMEKSQTAVRKGISNKAGSGEIKMSHIWNEIDSNDPTADGQSTNQNIRLAGLSDGTMDSINEANDAANRPDQSAPHQMSEFYLYDHDAESDDLDVPGNLHEDNVDHDSMTLDWNQVTYDGSPVDSYEVIWGTYAARTNAGNTTVTNITNTYYALSSLNASTNYYWWIRSKETDHPDTYSAWSGTQIRGTSAVPTTYSGTIADFSMSTSVLGTVYSVVKSFTVKRLQSSNPTSFIASTAPSPLSIIVTTRSTTYPASRIFSAALIDEPPVVVTSSNIVILEPFNGRGPSIHAPVPWPFASLRTINALSLVLLSKSNHDVNATALTKGSAPKVNPPTPTESSSTKSSSKVPARTNPSPLNITGLQLK